MTGVCLDQITLEFPNYPLKGKVENDIQKAFAKAGRNVSNLPTLPKSVGGHVDFMVGIKYLRYHPEVVFQMPSGLTIYRSMFKNADGGRGVIGGPHEIFSEIEKHFYRSNHTFIHSSQTNLIYLKKGIKLILIYLCLVIKILIVM